MKRKYSQFLEDTRNSESKYFSKDDDFHEDDDLSELNEDDDDFHPQDPDSSDSDDDDEPDDLTLSDDENDLDLTSDDTIEQSLTKTIINRLIDDIMKRKIENKVSLYEYLDEQEEIINEEDKSAKNIVSSSANEIVKKLTLKLIDEIRHDSYNSRRFDVLSYLENRLMIIDEINQSIYDDNEPNFKRPKMDEKSKLILIPLGNPFSFLNRGKNNNEEDPLSEEEDMEEQHPVNELDKQFLKFLRNGMFTPKNDLAYFKKLSDEDKQRYLDNIKELKGNQPIDKPKILKVIESTNSLNNKSVILNKLRKFDNLPPFSGEYFKLKNWVDGINKIPFGIYKDTPVTLESSRSEVKNYMNKVKKYMDDAVFGHETAKKQILRIIAHTISNPKEGGTIIAIQGPPGVGKTQLIQDGISKALQRPFEFISLGGATDSSFLEGHDYTYEGSQCGTIVNILKKAKCMNPVIFFDELDKVSDTPKGHEIINILTHLTDSTQNHHFNDKYYSGIDFDLSKCIFIFSFNEEHKVNRILKDRMTVIRTTGFKIHDKIKIAQNYLIPRLLTLVGFKDKDISFSDSLIEFIIENYTLEAGVRRLKEFLLEIITEVNLRKLDGSKIFNKAIKLPLTITKNMLLEDFFLKKHTIDLEMTHSKPKVGLVNGLWANDLGLGGIISIEAYTTPTSSKLELKLTGMQGDVMKESMSVARTVAWRIIPDKVKKELNELWNNFGNSGIHIHVPDGATPKDGPSAGAAITTAIVSLLMKRKVDNEIAMTGEINLKGQVTKIGGLSEKLNGAKKAGITTVLIPKGNEKDFNKIVQNEQDLIDKNFKVIMVDNIWDVLNFCLIKPPNTKKY